MPRSSERRDVSGDQWLALLVVGFGVWTVWSGRARWAAGSTRMIGRTSPLNLHGPDAVVFGCATILIGAGFWCLMRGVAKESHAWMATGFSMIAVALVGAVVGVIAV